MTSNKTRPALLLVEDDAEIREQIKWALASEYVVLEAHDRRTALKVVQHHTPKLVLLDLGLPPGADTPFEGLAALREIMQRDPSIKVVVITGNESRAVALEAVQHGAWDYVSKPTDLQALRVIMARAQHMSALELEWRQAQQFPAESAFCGMIGQSRAIKEVFEAVRRVAMTNISVLITGESGTGKEMVARAIHALSSKAAQPFMPIPCGAMPETLLESVLFSHEREASTGADRQLKESLKAAEGGTVLLDEVSEIPPAVQVKLLRFFQDRQLERAATGREQIEMDLRILATTSSDLRTLIAEGRFREDLFYNLSVVKIMVPPLREREKDVLVLARAFAAHFGKELNKRVRGFSIEALKALQSYRWPGNVRELENRIKRAVLMAEGLSIRPADLELSWSEPEQPAVKLKHLKAEVEKDLIQRTLVAHNWNISRAAVQLDISRQSLHGMIKKYGLEKP